MSPPPLYAVSIILEYPVRLKTGMNCENNSKTIFFIDKYGLIFIFPKKKQFRFKKRPLMSKC